MILHFFDRTSSSSIFVSFTSIFNTFTSFKRSAPFVSNYIKMYYQSSVLALAALITTVHSHAAILAAVGDKGQSQGFLGMFMNMLNHYRF